MDWIADLLFIIVGLAVIVGLWMLLGVRRMLIYEYERGVLYRSGKFSRVLEPGAYYLNVRFHKVLRMDMRRRVVTLPGQEVLSADNVSIRISLTATFQVTDANTAINASMNFQEELYVLLQTELRDLVSADPVGELLTKRKQIGEALLQAGRAQAAGLGVELLSVKIKDLSFPGELKNIFAQVVNARQEGLAALERARGEGAALRSLANAARLLEDHPQLYRLRVLQALDGSKGNTIVLAPGMEEVLPAGKPGKGKSGK